MRERRGLKGILGDRRRVSYEKLGGGIFEVFRASFAGASFESASSPIFSVERLAKGVSGAIAAESMSKALMSESKR